MFNKNYNKTFLAKINRCITLSHHLRKLVLCIGDQAATALLCLAIVGEPLLYASSIIHYHPHPYPSLIQHLVCHPLKRTSALCGGRDVGKPCAVYCTLCKCTDRPCLLLFLLGSNSVKTYWIALNPMSEYNACCCSVMYQLCLIVHVKWALKHAKY